MLLEEHDEQLRRVREDAAARLRVAAAEWELERAAFSETVEEVAALRNDVSGLTADLAAQETVARDYEERLREEKEEKARKVRDYEQRLRAEQDAAEKLGGRHANATVQALQRQLEERSGQLAVVTVEMKDAQDENAHLRTEVASLRSARVTPPRRAGNGWSGGQMRERVGSGAHETSEHTVVHVVTEECTQVVTTDMAAERLTGTVVLSSESGGRGSEDAHPLLPVPPSSSARRIC